MVKSYLAVRHLDTFGIVASSKSNICSHPTRQICFTGGNEVICVWGTRDGILKFKLSIPVDINEGLPVYDNVTKLIADHTDRGRLVTAGYSDGSIRLWDWQKESIETTFNGHSSPITAFAKSYNGELLASGSADHDIIVWDTFARTAMFRLIGHTTPIIGLDFIYRKLGPDSHGQTVLDIAKPSHLISASHDGELRLWDFTSQRCLQVVTARTTKGGIHSFLLTPDQNHLILGGRGLELFSLKDRGLVEDDLVDESSEYILAYAGEIPRDSTKRINQLIFFVPNRRTTERALPNGVVLSTDLTRGYVPAEDKSFILASTGTRRIEVILRLDPIQQRRRLVRTLIRKIEKLKNRSKKIKVGNNVDVELQGLLGNDWVFEEDGSKACNEIDHALALLRQQISEAKKKSNSKKRPRGSMEADPVLIYKMAPQVIDSPKHKLLHMAATPTDGTLLFSTSSNLIQELKIDMDTLISTMAIHGIHDSLVSPAVNMSISSNDRILMAICKTQVSIWDLKSRKCTIRLEAEDGHSFNAGFFLPGDDYVLVGNALGFVLIYHLPTLTLVNKIQCHDGPIIDIHSMPNRSGFVTVGADKLLKTHKFRLLENTNLVNVDGIISFDTLQERELIDKPLCVRCSPDGRFIATGLNDNTVTVTFLDSLKIHLTLFGHTLPVTTIAWTSDGQRLASGSMDRHMKIWDPEFGNIIKSLQNGRRGHITTILFCNMTHYLVCANSQGSIQLWDSDIGERITTLEGSLAAVTCLASTQDTEVIAAANSDGSIQLWARTEEQIFLNEEREREANAKILKDAAKSGPLPTAAARDVISADRPTKPVIETVRNTEKLIDIIDQAIEEQNSLLGYKMAVDDWDKKGRNGSPPPPPTPKIELMGKSPRQHVLAALNSLTTEIVNEVLLALPLKYSITILEYTADAMEDFSKVFDESSIGALMLKHGENYCRAACTLVHAHFRYLSGSAEHSELLERLLKVCRGLVKFDLGLVRRNLVAITFLARANEADTHQRIDCLEAHHKFWS